jgi:mono/diheme cytochrome c family protein
MNSRSTNGLALKLSVLPLSCFFFSQLMLGVTVRAVQNTAPARQIVFNRDIRPILADKCWSCHGPDAPAKKIKLRLDSEDAANADLGRGRRAIVPGNPEQSQLVRRITSGDEMTRMPPVDSGRKLTQTEIDLLVEWVRQGARWQRHWSFITPIRPLLPRVKNKEWPKNAIDQFVLERLEREGIEPSPEADRATLIRRVSLDLTGLPPTPREVEDFLNDKSPNAYEKVVDRLLASPRYGERMAFSWLDAARYADTNGYQVDGDRSAWRWRDWVIEAFNQNKPFDQFVVEQLAGDLLPNATLDQKIATAFNRNHRINAEGGVVPEEYRVEYVVDRVDTTSTVFMGLTLGCARCHNHKYDPFTQKEYYQLTAYFNSIDEDGHSFDQGNSPPVMAAPTKEQQRRLRQFIQEIAQAEDHYNVLAEKSARTQRRWEKSLLASNNANQQWFPDDKLIARLPLDAQNAPVFKKSDRAHHDQDDRRKDEPERKFEIGFKEGSPRYVESPTGQGVAFDGKLYFDAGIRADFRYKSISKDYRERFTIATWVYPESEQSGSIITKVSDAPAEVENNVPRAEGYGLYFINGKIHFNMVFRWGEDTLRVETEEPLPQRQWSHIAVIFDGLKSWEDRLRIFVDGREAKLKFNQRNFFMLSGGTRNTLKIGAGGGPQFRFRGALDEVRIYSRALDPDEIAALACADSLEKIAATPAADRARAQALKIHGAFLAQAAPDTLKQARDTLVELKRQKQSFEDDLPTLMVMEETPQPRPTSLLKRGAYDAPGEKVERGVPATLPPLRPGGRGESAGIAPMSNRLDFARWLVRAEHPLTSRVAVNRFWQMLFGAGLVRTTEDFGTRGELPSHPELLDWLAVEFRDRATGRRGDKANNPQSNGWNVKSLLKTMVMSATYRQPSKITPQSQQRDPDNRLLARGPRFRLPAEMIRDQALFVSGLLVEKLGGPSVKPYQPDGLYKDMAFSGLTGYNRDEGEGLWRRSLYTFWKRTVLSPTMRVFDASAREYCTVRDTRTNTPLQSLNLMNDVTYVEAARLLAQRMLREGGATPQARVAWAFLVAASRWPSERELQVLLRNLSWQMDYFGQNPRDATRLLSIGEKRNEANLDAVELAAYSATASLILNLDEVITKQ